MHRDPHGHHTQPEVNHAAMEIDMKKYARPASFGALAVALGLVAFYVFMVWVSMPAPLGGMDSEHAMIAYIGIACPLAAIAAVHVAFYKQLSHYAKEQGTR